MGLWDPYSDLCFRVLNLGKPREINGYFFLERLQSAIKIRQELETQGTTGYRVINGESDGFPGLVLDRYEDTLVLKLYTTSWFPFLDDLCELFQKEDRKSTRLNSSHKPISYAVFCLKKKTNHMILH